jgi:hypothetical protein
MNKEKTYPKVMRHYSLGSSIVCIRSKLEVLPSSSDFPPPTWQCHHSRVVKTTQITHDLVDQLLGLGNRGSPSPKHGGVRQRW